jgi:hypothetical protein
MEKAEQMDELERLWVEGFARRGAAIMKKSSKPREVFVNIIEEVLTAMVGFYGPAFPWQDLEEALEFLGRGEVKGNC